MQKIAPLYCIGTYLHCKSCISYGAILGLQCAHSERCRAERQTGAIFDTHTRCSHHTTPQYRLTHPPLERNAVRKSESEVSDLLSSNKHRVLFMFFHSK